MLMFIFFLDLTQEEGWVVCRVFKKRITAMRKVISEHESPIWYDDQVSFMQDLESPKQISNHSNLSNYHIVNPYPCKKELDLPYQLPHHPDHFLQLPLLDINHTATLQSSSLTHQDQIQRAHHEQINYRSGPLYGKSSAVDDQLTDWRVMDKFVASQLSQGEIPKEKAYSNAPNYNMFHGSAGNASVVVRHLEKQEMVPENASISSSSCQIELWK